LAPGSLNSRFSSRRRRPFGSTSTAHGRWGWSCSFPRVIFARNACVRSLARVTGIRAIWHDWCGMSGCRRVQDRLCEQEGGREPEDGKWTVLRVCSHCACHSAPHLVGVELVVRRDSARTVLTTVTNAGGPRRAASASHVCHRKIAWCAHVLSMSMLSIGP
jgi:hypothetical protein